MKRWIFMLSFLLSLGFLLSSFVVPDTHRDNQVKMETMWIDDDVGNASIISVITSPEITACHSEQIMLPMEIIRERPVIIPENLNLYKYDYNTPVKPWRNHENLSTKEMIAMPRIFPTHG